MLPYTEVQRFRQPWILVLLFLFTGFALWGIIQQLVMGKPFGDNPAPDWALTLIIFFLIALLAFFFFMRLETRIDETGVTVRFVPFHLNPRKFSWDNIADIHIRKYMPLSEYGGWGIRYKLFKKSMAYNVSGRMGIQLVLKNGRKILIGTQNPEDVEAVIQKLKEKNVIK